MALVENQGTNGRNFRCTSPRTAPPGMGPMLQKWREEPPEYVSVPANVVAKPKASKNLGKKKRYG